MKPSLRFVFSRPTPSSAFSTASDAAGGVASGAGASALEQAVSVSKSAGTGRHVRIE
jgi:hypothetical protein